MRTETKPLAGRRILIVEDDYLVGLVLVDALEDAGAEVLGPIGLLEEAIAFVQDRCQQFDAAILDVNLHGKRSYPIADALTMRSIRFLFATGYGGGILEDKYQRHPRCEKPFDLTMLVETLATI